MKIIPKPPCFTKAKESQYKKVRLPICKVNADLSSLLARVVYHMHMDLSIWDGNVYEATANVETRAVPAVKQQLPVGLAY